MNDKKIFWSIVEGDIQFDTGQSRMIIITFKMPPIYDIQKDLF